MNIEIAYQLTQKKHFFSFLKSLSTHFVIICDTNTKILFGECLEETLQKNEFDTLLLSFPGGENHKSRASKENLEDQMLSYGVTRDWGVIALGGGIVTDLAGFTAATFLRGLPLVLLPTTLLCMVDACIGGKTAVNTPYGKNLIGAFYPAKGVFMNTFFLEKLPLFEIENGFSEMIKHGLIFDKSHFNELEKNFHVLKNLEEPLFSQILRKSIAIKQQIVALDEKENGIRRILNFGHTIGHGLELLSNYTLAHGRAVAIGCLAESYISLKMSSLKEEDYLRIENCIYSFFPSLKLDFSILAQDLIQAMRVDKKSNKEGIRCNLLQSIGESLNTNDQYVEFLDDAIITETVKEVINGLH